LELVNVTATIYFKGINASIWHKSKKEGGKPYQTLHAILNSGFCLHMASNLILDYERKRKPKKKKGG